MADLLTPGDYAEIKAAIQDTTDTFFKVPILYTKIKKGYSKWQNNKEDNSTSTEYNLLALDIYDKTGASAKNSRKEIGSMSLLEGYLYFNWWDLEKAGNPSVNKDVTDFVYFVNANSQEEAEKICNNLPFTKANMVSYNIHPVGVFWLGEYKK